LEHQTKGFVTKRDRVGTVKKPVFDRLKNVARGNNNTEMMLSKKKAHVAKRIFQK